MKILFLILYVCSSLMLNAAETRSRTTQENTSTQPTQGDETVVPGDLHWRALGPNIKGGSRVNDVVSVRERPDQPFTIYVGGVGGLWKSDDDGSSWRPLFDEQPSLAVGALALDPSHPKTVWAGTGDYVGWFGAVLGEGIFKSIDGGEHWQSSGLRTTGFITRVVIDPRNSNAVFAAAPGLRSNSSRERGLYETTDGGLTWKQVLFVNDHTGVIDAAIDPADHNVIFAAAIDMVETAGYESDIGPDSGIYRSLNGGKTWQKLGKGLPIGDLGRIGLSISRSRPKRVYALIDQGEELGVSLYRSDDLGDTWRRVSEKAIGGGNSGVYFGKVAVDPLDADKIYVLNNDVFVSFDGGLTYDKQKICDSYQPAQDNHAIWIDPNAPYHLMFATDRGVIVTWDEGVGCRYTTNIPGNELYAVDADFAAPFYNVHVTAQDAGAYSGPVRSRSFRMQHSDWTLDADPESGGVVGDPVDPGAVYITGENVIRTNRKTHIREFLNPLVDRPDELPANRKSPLVVSHFEPRTLYWGGVRMFRSIDRGSSWVAISDVLTGAPNDAITVMGRTIRRDLTFNHFTIDTISESPASRDVLYVGTDDGRFYVTRNAGTRWTRVPTPIGAPAVPSVTRIVASSDAPGTAYLTINAVMSGDYAPYVFRTNDYGEHWTTLTDGLPQGAAVWAIRQDPRAESLLFLGTDRGVFFTLNGRNWQMLGKDVPRVRVTDITIQTQMHDLIVATWGRGVYVLDDIGPLEEMSQAKDTSSLRLFQVRAGIRYHAYEEDDKDSAFQYYAPNLAYGALISYYLPTAVKTKDLTLKIIDDQGAVLRNIDVSGTPGLHRFTWPLDMEPIPDAGPDLLIPVNPGAYHARLSVEQHVLDTPIQVLQDSLLTASLDEFRRQSAALVRLAELQREIGRVLEEATKLINSLPKSESSIATPEANKTRIIATRIIQDIATNRDQPLMNTLGLRIPVQDTVSTLRENILNVESAPTVTQMQSITLAEQRLSQDARELSEVVGLDQPLQNKRCVDSTIYANQR